MNRWSIIGAIFFGAVLAFYKLFSLDAVNPIEIKGFIAFFLFGFYCAIVIFGTSDKKRSLSLLAQTLLGIAVACAIAAVFGASGNEYSAAIAIGFVFGLTAHWWLRHMR